MSLMISQTYNGKKSIQKGDNETPMKKNAK